MAHTALERALMTHDAYWTAVRDDPTIEILQETVDRITDAVCAALTPTQLLDHTRVVYDETAAIYWSLPDHWQIPDSLITFMNLPQLAEGSRILELGAGPLLRDACFMGATSRTFRASIMGRMKDGKSLAERAAIPKHAFRVTATDSSERVLAHAAGQRLAALDCDDVNAAISYVPQLRLLDMHNCAEFGRTKFDGVWSCTALFTHTPRALVFQALRSAYCVLVEKGVLGVSYPAGEHGAPYDKLLLSRTGRVKYFSQPTPTFIASEAEKAGFYLIGEEYADLVRGSEIKKDFFVTQFFQKQ